MHIPPETEAAAEALWASQPGMRAGPFLLGFFVDAILLGVVIMFFWRWQVWSAKKEHVAVRVLVYSMMLFSIGYSVFLVVLNMRIFAYYYGEWGVFMDKSFVRYTYLLETCSRTPVSTFFALRAYRLGGRSKIFLVVLSPLMLLSPAGAIWACIDGKKLFTTPESMIPIFVWIGAEVLSDFIITAFLTYHLVQSRTGWKQTDKAITKLIVLAAETQLPPAVLATVFLIITIHSSRTPLGAFFCFMPNLYFIALLTVLNKRYALRREMDYESTSYHARNKETYGLRARRTVVPANIQVTTETVRHIEDDGVDDSGTFEGEHELDKGSMSGKDSMVRLDYSSSETRLTKPED